MHTHPPANPRSPNPFTIIRTRWSTHAPLTLAGLLMASLTVLFIVGILADRRVITGAPAWLKPTKFGISITLYTLTLSWILGFIRGRRRLVQASAWTVIATLFIEMSAIVTQVLRGTASHFNVATPFDTAVYSVMGMSVVILWAANFVIAALLLFQRLDNPAFAWSMRLAVLVTLLGMALGFLMTSPSARQEAAWEAGAPITLVGAHAVGVADGGPGLPVTGWSTTGGDLRIPHFFGLHALQLLPFFGWLVSRRPRLSKGRKTLLVWIGALGYLAFVGLLTQQAWRGQSIIHPDLVTSAAFSALVAAIGLAILVVVRLPDRHATSPVPDALP